MIGDTDPELFPSHSGSRSFAGISGTVVMDSSADREPNYWLWHMAAAGDQFEVWTDVQMTAPIGQVRVLGNFRVRFGCMQSPFAPLVLTLCLSDCMLAARASLGQACDVADARRLRAARRSAVRLPARTLSS